MREISFKTRTVFDHLPRTLDVLNRMGFRLHAARVDVISGGLAAVEIEFEPAGVLSESLLCSRLRQMHGITDFVETSLERATPHLRAPAGRELPASGLQ